MNPSGDDRHVLPPLLTGRRRRWFSGLVIAGLVQAGAAAATVIVLRRGLGLGTRTAELSTLLALAAIALGVGWTRARERVLAEQLGQDYAQDIRLRLVEEALDDNRPASLGTTLTRASNDLTSVRNWVALGISPIAVGIPMLLGCMLVLAAIHPLLALGVLVPLLVLGVVFLWGSRAAYTRSRRVRRERGRLAGHLADTLMATPAIRSAGGNDRELKRVEDRSTKMVHAAVDRARVLGRIRGATAVATGIATAAMIGCSMAAGLSGSSLVAALTVVGLLSGPVQDLGRVVEYRQTYRAARTALAPSLTARTSAAAPPEAPEETAGPTVTADDEAGLAVHGLRVRGVTRVLPALSARPGDKIVVQSRDRTTSTAALAALVGLDGPQAGRVEVAGRDILAWPPRLRRTLVGYAAQGMRLERTTIRRAVRYRHPETPDEPVDQLLTRVGLRERVAALPKAADTTLRVGWEPLSAPDRARLLLARAVLNKPLLLVLNHLDAELDPDGRAMLHDLLVTYPGVVVLASDHPESVMRPTQYWNLDGMPLAPTMSPSPPGSIVDSRLSQSAPHLS